MAGRHFAAIGLLALLAGPAWAQPVLQVADAASETVVVTAQRQELLGTATTSSQGVVSKDEIQLLPAFRPGQLLETVPGLVVTSHSGEGKADQYLLRGVNLDHGTDLATFVDGMPINEPTHAHGQGYTDTNFLVPEITGGVNFTKGPYFTGQGDFASVGSVALQLVNRIDDQIKLATGTLGFARLFAAGMQDIGDASLVGAIELAHYDGPWVHPDNQRKANVMLRYVDGDAGNGFTVTGLYYRSLWDATTDQPVRAIAEGLITRYGTLNPTDSGQAQRMSLSAQWNRDIGMGHLEANAYAINNRLTLWNDFTHFLDDPIHGDQEAQNELRGTFGAGARYTLSEDVFGVPQDFSAGISDRYDENHVFRNHVKNKKQFLNALEDDHVVLNNISAYADMTTHWTPWLRSVLGVREDVVHGGDHGTNTGSAAQAVLQPKASLAVTPFDWLELYVSAGEGFHTDDLRGVTQAAQQGIAGAPLIAKETGEEVGLRGDILPSLTATLTAFYLKSQSETTYDADAGQDSAGPGSRRTGAELNTTWQATDWLEFYTSLAVSHARYTEPSDDGTGNHIGTHIPNAPKVIGSLAAYVKNLGPWSGGLEYRYLGEFAVTPDNKVTDPGYGEFNLDAAYAFDAWKVGLGIYNLLDTHANAAAFYYVDRLPGEPAAGIADLHIHPLEPRSVRITLTRSFS